MNWINMAECGVQSPHEPHSWREGFLWHSKKSCKGMTHIEAVSVRDEQLRRAFRSGLYGVNPNQKKTDRGVVYSKIKPHKHKYKLKWVDDTKLMFECEKCQHQNPTDRESLYYALTFNSDRFKPWQ